MTDKIEMKFPKDQFLILNYLEKNSEASVPTLVSELSIDQVFIAGAMQTLEAMGYISVKEEKYTEIKLGKEGELFKESGLPEKIIVRVLKEAGEPLHIEEVSRKSGLEQKVIGKTLKVLQQKGWAAKEGPNLKLSETQNASLEESGADEKLFQLLLTREALILEESTEPFVKEGYRELDKRSGFLNVKERVKKIAVLVPKGSELLKAGIAELVEATQLTPELLKDKQWKNVQFKPYDIKAEAQAVTPGKIHPYQRILNETRKVYLEMGFTEISSSHVEAAFWDFDALFQPQDHPARDMQDTFYMKAPGTTELHDMDLVNEIKATHENGGKTGSKGWRYKWSLETAKQMVLRTHTTAASIQQIHRTPDKPLKVFCIGRVFRRETVDYKHLPVFTQVDGIVVDPKASLAHLIGVIQEFYRKMGFDKIDVRPAFFPYTEPSLEVFVYMEERKDWVEMGGAGIFRKEVTVPMGCDMPVLAWGLGLERLAMFRYNISDIRDIYIANIKWLREVTSCQL